MTTDTRQPFKSVQELHNANLDRSVDPLVMTRGIMTKTSAGSWVYAGSDAGYFRVSALGVTVTPSPLSADSSSVSAIQGDASNLHVSVVGTLTVSAHEVKQSDAASLRVSAIIDSGSISARSGDANQVHVSSVQGDAALLRTSVVGTLTVSAHEVKQSDAASLRVSAIIDSGSVSAKQSDAGNLQVSAKSNDGGLLRVSAINNLSANQSISAVLLAGTANIGYVSATVDNGSISARSSDANQVHVSSVQGDAALLRVSSIGSAGDHTIVDGSDQTISATLQRVSGVVSSGANAILTYNQNRDDAVNLRASAISKDGGTMRVSAINNLSANQSISAVLLAGTANIGYVSATIDNGSVSAKQSDAGNLMVSAKSGDAALFRVSALGVTATSSPLSADSSSVSAKQGDAANLRVSAVQSDAGNLQVSAKSGDAALFRVSAVGGTAGDNTLVDGTDQTLSATIQRVSGTVSGGGNALLTYAQNRDDAVNLRTSAIQADASLQRASAIQSDAANLMVSAKSGDAALHRISGIGNFTVIQPAANALLVSAIQTTSAGNLRASAFAVDAGQFHTSAFVDSGSVSAKQSDAVNLNVSAKSGDAGTFRVSAVGGTAGDNTIVDGTTQTISATLTPISASPANTAAGLVTNDFQFDAGKLLTSAKQGDAGLLHVSAFVDNGSVSAKSSDAGTLLVSAKQGDGANLRVSAIVDNGSVSARSGDANQVHVSAVQGDAGLLHVSVVGTLTVSSHEVKQSDAASLRVSAILDSGSVSAKSADATQLHVSSTQADAGLLRVSSQSIDRTTSAFMTAIGDSLSISALGDSTIGLQLSGTWTGTIAFQATVDESNWFPLWGLDNSTMAIVSASTTSRNIVFDVGGFRRFRLSSTASMTGTLSAFMNASLATDNVVVAIKQEDAGNARLSAILDNGSVSAKSGDANQVHVSAVQGDAGLFHVSAVGTITVSAHEVKQSDAASLRVSAIVDNGSVSAKSGDANQVHVSAVQGDAGLLHTSTVWTTVGNGLTLWTSAFSIGTTGGVAVVNGVTAKKIYIYGITLGVNQSTAVKWQISGNVADLTANVNLSASAGYANWVTPPAYVIATTSAGSDLVLNVSAAASAAGWVAGWSI